MPQGFTPWAQPSWIHHLGGFHIWHMGSLPGCSMAAPPSWNPGIFEISKSKDLQMQQNIQHKIVSVQAPDS